MNTASLALISAFMASGLSSAGVDANESKPPAATPWVSPAGSAREAQAALEVRNATEAFYRALNGADPVAADDFLLPGGDSFPRNGAKLLPEAPTADQSLKDLKAVFAAGLRFDVKIRDLQVKTYGSAAIATFYLDGTTTPAANRPPTRGVFRASYVWIRQADGWKIAHFHISPLNAGG